MNKNKLYLAERWLFLPLPKSSLLMLSETITVEKKIKAPAELIWKALTSATQMKNWYFAMEKFIAEPGFSFTMYGEREGKYYPIHCTIVEAIKNKLLSYTWSYEEYPAETIVCFELFENDQQTILKLTHKGLQKIPASFPALSFANHVIGWKHIIGKSLKNYVEKIPRS
jgi:uncharacterized protein YndB with AHSA1/START domain